MFEAVKQAQVSFLYIYGTTHLLQISVPLQLGGTDLITLGGGKLHYARDLAEILTQYPGINLVAEEASPCWPSIAEEIAHLGIRRYTAIDMPKGERNRRGIPQIEGPTIDMTTEGNKRAKQEREAYIFARVDEWLPDIGDVLVICGLYHVRGLKNLFEARGHQVIADGVSGVPGAGMNTSGHRR